jgi:protein required for attachment to host cells
MSNRSASNDTAWVVVADEHVARFLELPAQGLLHEVETLREDAPNREAALRDDAQGRRAPSIAGGAGGAPTLGTGTVTASAGESELHLEAERFARRVATTLTERRQQRRFNRLRIVAAPRFLGLLRAQLDATVTDTLADDLDKDLTHLNTTELTRRLFPDREGAPRKLEPRAAQEVRSGNDDIRH